MLGKVWEEGVSRGKTGTKSFEQRNNPEIHSSLPYLLPFTSYYIHTHQTVVNNR